MLRSLVGSEMCIRDSFTTVSANNRKLVLNPLIENNGQYTFNYDLLEKQVAQGARMLILSNPHNPIGCLLYTSDAADDLLCVDLGGRRIIKKKKTTHTVHTDQNPIKAKQLMNPTTQTTHM